MIIYWKKMQIYRLMYVVTITKCNQIKLTFFFKTQ